MTIFRYKQCQHTGNLIVNDTVTLDGGGPCKGYFFFRRQMFRPTPDQCQSQALRVLIGHRNFRLCQGLCRVIADPTISTMYPTIETQSHSSYSNPTFPFSISLFPFWIPLSIYNSTIKISNSLFQVIRQQDDEGRATWRERPPTLPVPKSLFIKHLQHYPYVLVTVLQYYTFQVDNASIHVLLDMENNCELQVGACQWENDDNDIFKYESTC